MYLAVLTAAGLGCTALAVYAWRHRRHPGYTYLAVMEAATAWWVLCYVGEQVDAPRALTWFALKFPAIAAVSPSWLLFTLTQLGERPRGRVWWLAYVWPVVIGPLMLTNPSHHLVFTDVVRRSELVGLNGPLFAFHLALSYTYMLAANALLFRDWRRRGSVQSGLLCIGGAIPFVGNVLNEFTKAMPGLGTVLPMNPTLPGIAFSALFVGAVALRYRQLDPRPVAHDALFESMPEVVLVLNTRGMVVDANRAARAMLGLSDRQRPGLPWTQLFPEPWHGIPYGSEDVVEREWTSGDRTSWLEVRRQPLWDAAERSLGLLVVIRDVTSRKQLEQELRAHGYRDRLTGLSNRRFLDDEAARLQASCDFPVAVFAFDLDGLKQVNDRHGHAAGDGLLESMAQFLQQFFRAGDRVIRQGGDEFLVLLPRTGADEADRIRARLPVALAAFNADRGTALRFSTGVSVIADTSDWAPGMARADARLYDAKRDAVEARN